MNRIVGGQRSGVNARRVAGRAGALAGLCSCLLSAGAGAAGRPWSAPAAGGPRGGSEVLVNLTEWRVALAPPKVSAGRVTFRVTNAGSIPHAFEVEGRGVERETPLI